MTTEQMWSAAGALLGLGVLALFWVTIVKGRIGFRQGSGRRPVREQAEDLSRLSVSELINRPYTVEDHRRDIAYRYRQERRAAARTGLAMVALAIVLVLAFAPYGSVEFLRTYWQPMVLFTVGVYGIVQAKRLVDKFNTWDVPYTLSIVVGFGGLVLGVIRLVQIVTG
jgi:hypothetical protein